ERVERAADDRERRQQQLEHTLGIARDNQERNQELADGAERHHRAGEQEHRARAGNANQQRKQQNNQAFNQAQQDAQRQEQQQRLLQIALEVGRPPTAFGQQPQ